MAFSPSATKVGLVSGTTKTVNCAAAIAVGNAVALDANGLAILCDAVAPSAAGNATPVGIALNATSVAGQPVTYAEVGSTIYCGVDTSSFSSAAGGGKTVIYVGNAGTLSETKPTAADDDYCVIVGIITVFGADGLTSTSGQMRIVSVVSGPYVA